MDTVLVTGAAGTVGNYVVGLAEASGFRVIATDLSASGVQVPVRGDVRPGDLRDAAFVERLLRGVDHVIHTAAMLDVANEAQQLERDVTGERDDQCAQDQPAERHLLEHREDGLVSGLESRPRGEREPAEQQVDDAAPGIA